MDSHTELFNMVFIDSNFEIGGYLRKLQYQTCELLNFVVNVCEKYNFTYWLDYGTLVGAVRHGGFVPWDDEADIAMPREDYEVFVQIIENEVANYPQLDNVELRMGVGPLRNVTYKGKPSLVVNLFKYLHLLMLTYILLIIIKLCPMMKINS